MRLLVLTPKKIFRHRSRILKQGVLSCVTAVALPLCHCRSMAMGGGCRSPGNVLYLLCPRRHFISLFSTLLHVLACKWYRVDFDPGLSSQ